MTLRFDLTMGIKMADDEFFNERKSEYINLLSDLIRQKTVNPPGNEYLAAEIIEKKLDQLKIPYTLHEKEKGRTNIIARIGNSGKTILFNTHLDTVPAGDGWHSDPFEPVIKDNKLYGRGAIDDKGQAVAILLIAEYLKAHESKLRNSFVFVWAADEELGSGAGIKFLLDENLLDPDFVIIPDISGAMRKIDIAEKGVCNIRVTALGKQAHGSRPALGVSAIAAMADLISRLKDYTLEHSPHPFLSAPTINFGTIKGGSAPNTVAAKCELVLNVRYLPGQSPEGILEELKHQAEDLGTFDFEVLLDLKPTEVDPEHFIVRAIQEGAQRFGIEARPVGLSGATDTKHFLSRGIFAIGYDFTDDGLAHNADEFCDLDRLFLFAKVMVSVCFDIDHKISS